MKIQTLSIVVGTEACNAKCPFCVSKMTGAEVKRSERINWRNFNIGCRFAKQCGVSTALLTGKGEPTLFPTEILSYIRALKDFFPFIELQTNGYLLGDNEYENNLHCWYDQGLTTVILSIVHYDPYRNSEVFRFKKNLDLIKVIDRLHEIGFSVRLSCIMAKDYIASLGDVLKLLTFASRAHVEQVTVRSVAKPSSLMVVGAGNTAENNFKDTYSWVLEHAVDIKPIQKFFNSSAVTLMKLVHGATVYDYLGQNVCVSSCLTLDPNEEEIRQLIFFPDGHLKFDWTHPGAILI